MSDEQFINRLNAFSRPKIKFGYVNVNKVEVHFQGTVQFITRSEAFTLLKLFLHLRKEELEFALQTLEQQVVTKRNNLTRATDLLAQLPHKRLGDGCKLLTRIVENDTEKPDWAI